MDKAISKDVSEKVTDQWEGWKVAIVRYYPKLMRYSRTLTGNHADAEDLAQEACYRVLDRGTTPNVEDYRGTAPNAKDFIWGYLRVVVRNIFNDKLKKETKAEYHVSIDDEYNRDLHAQLVDTLASEGMQKRLENQEFMNRLQASLGAISEHELTLLTLHLNGWTAKEIAAELGKDVRLVRYDLNAVRSKVRYRLAKQQKKRRVQ